MKGLKKNTENLSRIYTWTSRLRDQLGPEGRVGENVEIGFKLMQLLHQLQGFDGKNQAQLLDFPL